MKLELFLYFAGLFQVFIPVLTLSNEIKVATAYEDCKKFFHANPWPMPKEVSQKNVVKLCQTQIQDNIMGKAVFATLFNPFWRIPVYSANMVRLNKTQTVNERPDSKAWLRVAKGLCNINAIPSMPIYSKVGVVPSDEFSECRKNQAVSEDYLYNNLHLDRGHLSPNHINSRDHEKQLGTFTLTNAAPQFADFNRQMWQKFECITEYAIINLVPNENVYIITGIYGTAMDENHEDLWLNRNDSEKNPVKVPGYYWKAVCYPGNPEKEKEPWGYAIVKPNINVEASADYKDLITLKKFSEKYFDDAPFGPVCINAPIGDFATIFPEWENYIMDYCQLPKITNIVKNEL